MTKNILYKTTIILLIIFFLLAFFAITTQYPLHGDDWTYRFIFTKDTVVKDFSDVLVSQRMHWFTWGGRFVAHCMVQSVLLLDKCWFNIANTVCYGLCCLCMSRLIFRKDVLQNFLLILFTFWLIMPSTGDTMFWLTGSFNYLWPSMFTMVFLCLLFSKKNWHILCAVPLALIAGNGHESISLGISATLVIYTIISPRKPLVFYIAITCYIIGMLTNVIAPGNFVRLDSVITSGESGLFDITLKYFKHILKVGYRLTFNWSDLGVQCCFLMWGYAALTYYKSRKSCDFNTTRHTILMCLLIGCIVSLCLNIISGTTYTRAVYGFCFLSYLTFTASLSHVEKKAWLYRCLLSVALITNIIFIPIVYTKVSISHENVTKAIHYSQTKKHIAIAHPDSSILHDSRFCSYTPSPCLLNDSNKNLAALYGGEDISLLEFEHARLIFASLNLLKQTDYHKTINLPKQLRIARLQSKPTKIIEHLSLKPLNPAERSYTANLKHWISSQRKPEKSTYVIRINDNYYLYWISNNYHGSANIVYKDKKSLTIAIE